MVDIKQYVEIATFNVLVDPFSSEHLLILYRNVFFCSQLCTRKVTGGKVDRSEFHGRRVDLDLQTAI